MGGKLPTPLPFVGDDTWTALFPGRFSPSAPFASFNVRDLDTCDRGVMEHLPAFLQKHTDAPLVLAHMLGVDHAGHRYGPVHDAMARKLRDVDAVLSTAILPNLTPDDLLVIVGDHGMTPAGDHGGESALETSAALFMYSPGRPLGQVAVPHRRVHQTDLVPTLALLLGAPIPFSSVGVVLPELFGEEGAALEALRLNAHQVVRFFQAYEEATGTSREAMARLAEQLSAADGAALAGKDAAVSVVDRYAAVLATARGVAERTWSTFDVGAMVAGALLGVVTGASALLAPMQLLRPWPFVVSARRK